MTTKVAVGNGRFCYSGPNCRLHGTAQIGEAKRQLFEAEDRLSVVLEFGTFAPEQVAEARREVREAQELYDATTEGQQYLRDFINRFDPTILPGEPLWYARRDFQRRLRDAETYADRDEEYNQATARNPKARPWEEKPDADGLVGVSFASTHSYRFSLPQTEDLGWAEQRTGAKFREDATPAETKRALSAEIKKAISENYLPSNVEYNISASRTGNSVDLTIRGLNVYAVQVDKEVTPEEYDKINELERRLDNVMNLFNQTTYPKDNSLPRKAFRATVDFELPSERKDRLTKNK